MSLITRKVKDVSVLFSSHVPRKIISFFIKNPSHRVTGSYLIKTLGLGKESTYKWLKKLSDSGFLMCISQGRIKRYCLNTTSPIYRFIYHNSNIVGDFSNLTYSDFHIMRILCGVGSRFITQSCIRRLTNLSSGLISEELTKLEEKDFISRHRVSGDKKHYFSLKSPSIKKLLEKLYTIRQPLHHFTPETLKNPKNPIRKRCSTELWKQKTQLEFITENYHSIKKVGGEISR